MNLNLPYLGVGLGFRDPMRSEVFLHRDDIDFLEITIEHFLNVPPQELEFLDLLADHWPLVPHGLNLSLGSAEGLDMDYLQQVGRLIDRVQPPWWSEHIAFTRAGGVDIGHLAPLPFTQEAVSALHRNISQVQQLIQAPLILENITYPFAMPGAQMSEAQFLSEILERTHCGLLLDITNLYINSVNHRYDPLEWLEQLPVERIVQFHFVGVEDADGQLIDSHARATSVEVWQLMDAVAARVPVKGMILERDEEIPAFGELLAELDQARKIGERYGRW